MKAKFSFDNKKVLLRERKKHTARRVASARYAALSEWVGEGDTPSMVWGDMPSQGGGYPILEGVPRPGLDGGGVYPIPGWRGYPSHVLMVGGTPSQVVAVPWAGLDGGGIPHLRVGGTPAKS